MSSPVAGIQSPDGLDGTGNCEAGSARTAGRSEGSPTNEVDQELRASSGLSKEQAEEGVKNVEEEPTPCRSTPQSSQQQQQHTSNASPAAGFAPPAPEVEGAAGTSREPGIETSGNGVAGAAGAQGSAAASVPLPKGADPRNATKNKGGMPSPPQNLSSPLPPGIQVLQGKAPMAPAAPTLRPMAKSAMPKTVPPVWPKAAATCTSSTAPSAFGRTLRADGGHAPQISNRELIRGPLQNIPNFRLNELKGHLRDLLAAEDAAAPSAIVSVYCPPEDQSEDAIPKPATDTNGTDTSRSGDMAVDGATSSDAPMSNTDGSGDAASAGSTANNAGTWDCPACGETNKSSRSQCNNCGKTRPGIEGEQSTATGSAAGGSADSSGDGQCGVKRKRQSMLISNAWREGARAAAELSLKRKLEHAKEGEKLELYLRQINYTQDSIKMQFRDGRPVTTMRQELVRGEKKIEDIPTIMVLVNEGRVYTVDNRRLWAFKNCGLPENTRIPVIATRLDHSFRMKFTTPTGGRSVRRRVDGVATPAPVSGPRVILTPAAHVKSPPATPATVNPPGPRPVNPPGLKPVNPPDSEPVADPVSDAP